MVIVAAVFGVAFALNSILRGHVLPGLAAGALGAVVVFLVLGRVEERNAAVRRRRERDR
jgi:hypothetical protein